jgi:dephospho-CoA kinase
MLKVGLTGGIGSGKSVVAARLASLGAVIIDADRLAREVVAPGTDGFDAVRAAFGDGVLDARGQLDRAVLGDIVFTDAAARGRLEEIIHPRVRERTGQLVAAAGDAVVVNDVPLLAEVGLAPSFHLVVVVETAEPIRVERLARGRGMTTEQAYQRIRAQTDDVRRRAVADVVLRNDGPLAGLHAAVDALWRDRLMPYERNVRHRRAVRLPPPVRLVDPDPTWPDQYARIAARIRQALAPAPPRVDHIGSTSVPGLAAKDVIDVQLTVAAGGGTDPLAAADGFADRLADAGFPRYPGEWWDTPRPAGTPGRWTKRLHGCADPARPVNLHVRVEGTPGWRYALLVADHLRADPARRSDYERVKRRLAGKGLAVDEYTATKDPWFDEEYRLADRWADATGWTP